MSMDFIPHEYQKYSIQKIIENNKYGLFLDMGLRQNSLNVNSI